MGQVLNIDSAELFGGNQSTTRRVICVSQGDWFCPLLGYRAAPGAAVSLEDFIGYCRRSGRDEVLDKLQAKAARGKSIRLDDRVVPNDKLRLALTAHCPAAASDE